MSTPSFGASARRHLADAVFLHADDRKPNADHLSGLAAECALKALVLEGLGGTIMNGFVSPTPEGPKLREHVGGPKSVWTTVAALAQGRPEPEVTDLLREDPFHDWVVHDRYSEGKHITSEIVTRHIDGARRAAIALESVRLSNMIGGE
ncbi:hypothetical protein [Cellulosimicrobium cellulans]|uniref:hypothetical protein n=1 Tax=Cellulosimicrobium cellulans TaxID=1710 RepID=UPI002097F8C6|nr:hypothetical protein [Cellulosimicrobium cellulans]MCO7272251.1 hypothetical protein [Cellulosimicrobium cellulans]